MEWETIDDSTERTKVCGGWIVKHYDSLIADNGDTVAHGQFSMVFVPDEKHDWKLYGRIDFDKAN